MASHLEKTVGLKGGRWDCCTSSCRKKDFTSAEKLASFIKHPMLNAPRPGPTAGWPACAISWMKFDKEQAFSSTRKVFFRA